MSRACEPRSASDRPDFGSRFDAVWVAVTSAHVMLGYQYSKQSGRRLHIADLEHCDLGPWSETLGLPVRRFSLRCLIGPLLAAVMRLAAGRRPLPVLYLPHLSSMIFGRRQLWLLRALQRLSLIEYFDDGMASVSDAGILWRERLIPVEPVRLISWDYAFLPHASEARRLSVKDNHADLSRRFGIDGAGKTATQPTVPLGPDPANRFLVIAGNCLDWDHLITVSLAAVSVRDVVYVPHYREAKNNEFLLRCASVWRPRPNLELVLPGRIDAFSHCFFGVTSTIFYVLEAVRGMASTIDTVFAPVIDLERCAHPEEARDFLDRLRLYADDFNVVLP